MFYFLGIILDKDFDKGYLMPNYVLCKSAGSSKARSGLFVRQYNPERPGGTGMNKVLVKHPYGNESLIEYMSGFRTRNRDGERKFYPKGWLCYFHCNVYGEATGHIILIKHVPEKGRDDKGGFIATQETGPPSVYERLLKDPEAVELETSRIKRKFKEWKL